MIEEALLNYGVLGLWTATLIGERWVFQKGLKKSLDKLTEAIKEKL